MSMPACCALQGALPRDGVMMAGFRVMCINQILGTDMKKHFDITSRFQVILHGCTMSLVPAKLLGPGTGPGLGLSLCLGLVQVWVQVWIANVSRHNMNILHDTCLGEYAFWRHAKAIG